MTETISSEATPARTSDSASDAVRHSVFNRGRGIRLAILLAGLLLGQMILYGPSLIGRKILLPLDILAKNNHLIPLSDGENRHDAFNSSLSDLVYCSEPGRRFFRSEWLAGRLPLWDPNQFAGAPAIGPKLSPFPWLLAAVESPVIIAWVQLLIAILAGTGMYAFLRHSLGLQFWPAVLGASSYPLTGFFILWHGFTVPLPVVWLPWLLLAVRSALLRPSGFGGIGVAAVSMLAITAGQFDVSAQVLGTSGLYALWCFFSLHGRRCFSRLALSGLLAVALGWSLGILLAASDLIPAVTYAHTGARMEQRTAGNEERPPVGLAALPQVVFPLMYGTTEYGSFPFTPEGEPNLQESASSAYAGLLGTLFLAPLAFCDRRRRRTVVFLGFLAFLGLAWTLDIPGFVNLLRLPGLNMVSHSRFVFVSGFALVVLAAVGFEAVCQQRIEWRPWFWAPLLLFGLFVFSSLKNLLLPSETIAERAAQAVNTHLLSFSDRRAGDLGLVQLLSQRPASFRAGFGGMAAHLPQATSALLGAPPYRSAGAWRIALFCISPHRAMRSRPLLSKNFVPHRSFQSRHRADSRLFMPAGASC